MFDHKTKKIHFIRNMKIVLAVDFRALDFVEGIFGLAYFVLVFCCVCVCAHSGDED